MTVLVVGSLHLDVVLNAPHLPTLDETVTGQNVSYVFGGKGGNQAVAAAQLGATVHFAGRAGSDGFGDLLRATLADKQIDVSRLQRDPGPSGMSAAIVDAQGGYGAVIVSAANLNIDAQHITVPKDVSVVLLQNEIPEAVNLAVAQQAKEIGAKVWLNAAPARPLKDDLVGLLDLLIVNRVEAEYYARTDHNVETLVTLGSQGLVYREQSQPGFVVDVTSTHGAGDMFVGTLAAEVAGGTPIERALKTAQAAAALHVSAEPDSRANLTRDHVVAFLNAQNIR